MKKTLLKAAVLCSSVLLFAESYTVKSVTGKVTVQNGSKTVDVAAGKVLDSANIISTGLNTLLVVTDANGKDIKIKANQNGTVDTLVKAATTPASGIRKSTITSEGVAGSVSGTSKGTATASSRASEAKEDLDWDE